VCEISPRSSAPRASAARSGWRAPPQSAPSSWCLGVVGGDARAERRRRGKNPRADSHKGEGGGAALLCRIIYSRLDHNKHLQLLGICISL
jgi:hypothetical protein